MDPLTTFVTLVSLLCNWKQERGAVAQDRFQDFVAWLEQHHHNEIRSKIVESTELQRELGSLLVQDLKKLGDKLNVISSSVASVAQRLENFHGIATALKTAESSLSEQAVQVLKLFEQTGAQRMLVTEYHQQLPNVIHFLPRQGSFGVSDPRFVEDDVVSLEAIGFVREVDRNGDGCPIYALTRNGAAYASQFPEVVPTKA